MVMPAQPETSRTHPWRRLRYLPLAVGAAALVAGFWAGLVRIGLVLPDNMPWIAEQHGVLMICGFFGTLISLERAVALARPWVYAAPVFSAAGTLALFFDASIIAAAFFLAAGVVLTAASAAILRQQPALFMAVLTIAAASWVVGIFEWLADRPMPEVSGWWLAFLVLTIAAERLELSRLLQPPRSAQAMFAIAVAFILAGAVRGELARDFAPLTGLGFLACAAWLLVHDVARRTIRQSGQTRFFAVCMIAGYGWLCVAGLQLLVAPNSLPFGYDAAVHAVTIGFVLSMVFGHAMIILPAVIGLRPRYASAVYAPFVLLQLSVAIRIASDFFGWIEPRAAGGVLSIVALAGYAATLIVASARRVGPRH